MALILMDLCPTTLRAVAIYGLLDNVARVALGGPIGARRDVTYLMVWCARFAPLILGRHTLFGLTAGKWIDRTPRLRSALTLVIAQHGLVMASCLGLIIQLSRQTRRSEDAPPSGPPPPGAAPSCSEDGTAIMILVRTDRASKSKYLGPADRQRVSRYPR